VFPKRKALGTGAHISFTQGRFYVMGIKIKLVHDWRHVPRVPHFATGGIG